VSKLRCSTIRRLVCQYEQLTRCPGGTWLAPKCYLAASSSLGAGPVALALSPSRGRGSISARWPSYSQGPDNARAMSWENLEIFRQLNAAWNAGDVDAVRDFHDPNVILRPIEG
jgi:hypothetical protein